MKGRRPSIFVILFLIIFLLPCGVIGEEKKVFTLDELLSTALNANPSMAIFKANLEASRGEALEAFAYPNPEVDLQWWRGKSIETG